MIAEAVSGGQIPPDMPEFLLIMRLGILGNLNAERGIATRAASSGKLIVLLNVNRQREEGARHRPRLIDQRRVNAVIGNHRKAIVFKRLAKRCGEPGGITVRLRKRKRTYLINCCRHYSAAVLTSLRPAVSSSSRACVAPLRRIIRPSTCAPFSIEIVS